MATESVINIYKREAYLINLEQLDSSDVGLATELYSHKFYDEAKCKRCDLLPDRHSDTCDACASFKEEICLSKTVEYGNNTYLSLPFGNKKTLKRFLKRAGYADRFRFIARHGEPISFRRNIAFTGTLRDYQIEAVEAAYTKQRGVIESPPRSGKTVIGCALACQLAQKTIIIAHQREWLINFQETFLGSETQPKMTNARASQVKFCKKLEDFESTDVCLVTPNQFMTPKGKLLLKKIRHMFTLVLFDEVHQSAALQTSRVLSQINAPYKIGLSGTPDRKDGRYLVAENLIGDVIYKADIKRLRPRIQLMFTGLKFDMNKRNPNAFTYFVNRMESHQHRRDLIIKKAIQLAKEGHLVMIPLARVQSIKRYATLINQECEDDWARPFHGGLKDRKKFIEDARNYKFRIIVGQISLISTGINIPRASAIIDRCTPTSNLPKCQQRLSRILTPWDGKPDPVVVLVLDDSDPGRNMLRNEYWNCIHPEFNPIVDRLSYQNLLAYLAEKSKAGVPSLRDVFG